MHCPDCQHSDTKVLDSRASGDGIRRRRQCLNCGGRFTTHERIERKLPLVVKKDGTRAPFDREKLMAGFRLACRKRPVSAAALEAACADVESGAMTHASAGEIDSADLGKLVLENPVIAASGTFGYGLEYIDFLDLNKLGAFSTKGLSLKPRVGNPVPRVIETSSGMLNAIGLENIGLNAFLSEKLPLLSKNKTRIFVYFFGDTIQQYEEMATALNKEDRIDALEMNVSCPNVEEGGLQFSSDPVILEKVVDTVRKVTDKFLIVKLSPNVTNIVPLAKAAENVGADALSVCNTFVGMKINLDTGKPYLANRTGGLSGPAIKPLALNLVYETVRAVEIPVIGMGGISNADDAIEFLIAGAKAVQIGTANFTDPAITVKVIKGIREWCQLKNISRLSQIKTLE